MKNYFVALFLTFSAVAHAEETSSSQRSNPNAMFWVGGNGGVGMNDSGWGIMTDANLRLKFGRCGVIAGWRDQKIKIKQEAAKLHNSIFGAGATCTLFTFGDTLEFLKGSHVSAALMAEYGRSVYTLYDRTAIGHPELSSGSTTGIGGSWGVDYNFPLWFGLWANIGLGYENLSFSYEIAHVGNTAERVPHDNGYARMGLSFGL